MTGTVPAAAGYLSADDCRLTDLVALLASERDHELSSYPHADRLEQGLVGYDAIRRRHEAGDDWVERAGAGLPMGRLAQVDEIADVVVFFLSDGSGVITGSVLDWDQNIQGCHD